MTEGLDDGGKSKCDIDDDHTLDREGFGRTWDGGQAREVHSKGVIICLNLRCSCVLRV